MLRLSRGKAPALLALAGGLVLLLAADASAVDGLVEISQARVDGKFPFTISQAGTAPACTYNAAPTTAFFLVTGGTGTITVTTQPGCAWTATSQASFVTITAGSSGTGNGTVQYTVAANTGSASRTGTLTVAGRTVTITQDGTGSYLFSTEFAGEVPGLEAWHRSANSVEKRYDPLPADSELNALPSEVDNRPDAD